MNRPYLAEQESLYLDESIKNFNRIKFPISDEERKKNRLLEQKKELKENRIECVFICIVIFLIFGCLAFSVYLSAEKTARSYDLASIQESNQILMDENKKEENMLLSDIDGLNYREYAVQVLGMTRAKPNQFYYITKKEPPKEEKEKPIIEKP